MKFSKEKSQELADTITPILNMIDVYLYTFDFEYADASLKRMGENASTAMSASVIVGMDKADDAQERVDMYEAMINVFKVRKSQQRSNIKRLQSNQSRDDVARALGLM